MKKMNTYSSAEGTSLRHLSTVPVQVSPSLGQVLRRMSLFPPSVSGLKMAPTFQLTRLLQTSTSPLTMLTFI